MKTRILVVLVSSLLFSIGIAQSRSLANPAASSRRSRSSQPGGGNANQVNSANANSNKNLNGNANKLKNQNNNSSAAGIEAGFINTPQNTVNNQSGSNSASNSGNFGGSVRNNTTDQSGNSFNNLTDQSGNSLEFNVVNVVEQPNGGQGLLGGASATEQAGGGTYFVEESYSDIDETSYNVVFPSPPGTSKNGYVFSVSTGPKGVLSYQASCPTGGTSIGLGILLGSITFAENRTKLPKACKNVQALINDVISVKQGRDAASTLGPTFETVLEQEIYYRTMRDLGFSDEQIDQKLQAVHKLRQRHIAQKRGRPSNVAKEQPKSPQQVSQEQNTLRHSAQSSTSQPTSRTARR